MRSSIIAAFVGSASAKMIDVAIGEGGLKYSPDSITAAMGDIIRFKWPSSTPHNVVSSDFDSPCQSNGLIAAPVMSDSSTDFFVMINSTDPMFMYCSVSDHCNDGMVMAVNPSSDDTLAKYMSGAASASIMEPSPTLAGGILAAASATPFAAATMSAMAMTASAASASASAASSMSSAESSMLNSMAAATEGVAAPMTAAAGNSAAKATGMPIAVGVAAVGLGLLL